MFQVSDVIQLQPQEQVRALIRQSLFGMVPRLTFAGACIASPFFFVFSLTHLGLMGWSAFFLSVLFGIAYAYRAILLWDANVLIVTTQRLVFVEQREIWTRVVLEMLLVSVQDVKTETHGFFQRMFRVGSLHVRGSGVASSITAWNIPQPERVRGLMRTS